MSARQLQDVLDAIADTGEIVIRPQTPQETDELLLAWRNARAEANALLAGYVRRRRRRGDRRRPGRTA